MIGNVYQTSQLGNAIAPILSLSATFDQLLSRIFEPILSKITPYMTSLFDAFDNWTLEHGERLGVWVESLINQLPNAESLVNKVGGVLINASSILNTVVSYIGGWETVLLGFAGFKIIGSILSLIAPLKSLLVIIPLVISTFNLLKLALITNPIGFVVASIATGAVLIMQYWQPLSNFFSQLWGQIKTIFKQAVAWIQPVLDWSVNAIDRLMQFFGFKPELKLSATNQTKLMNSPMSEAKTIQSESHQINDQSRKNQKVEINNHIQISANNSDTKLIEDTVYQATEKAAFLFDIHGGY
ncbi:hypothetical protein L3V86_00270 [Thiotrichales bacterium 19S11-10]|nr:hypothetical protein [Thiotrichales bacterium 19S11-10]